MQAKVEKLHTLVIELAETLRQVFHAADIEEVESLRKQVWSLTQKLSEKVGKHGFEETSIGQFLPALQLYEKPFNQEYKTVCGLLKLGGLFTNTINALNEAWLNTVYSAMFSADVNVELEEVDEVCESEASPEGHEGPGRSLDSVP